MVTAWSSTGAGGVGEGEGHSTEFVSSPARGGLRDEGLVGGRPDWVRAQAYDGRPPGRTFLRALLRYSKKLHHTSRLLGV